MKISNKLALAAIASVCAFATTASAGSELFPGISTGIPLGAPLPEGVFVVGIGTTGQRDDSNVKVDAAAPWFIWSTPWKVAGGRLLLDTVTPAVKVSQNGTKLADGYGNTFLDAQIKWDLGQGWFGGVQAGQYLKNASKAVGRNYSSFQAVGAISNLANNHDYSATLVYGQGKNADPDWLNLDLTATKNVGKWELGGVGFLSKDFGDVSSNQFQAAVGPLVAYNFGPVKVQAKYTTTLQEKNYGGKDNRFWVNVIAPLYLNK